MKLPFSYGKLLAILAGIIVVGAVAASIWINPPSEIRARSIDRVRLNDLQSIESSITRYYNLHHALPVDLKTLESDNGSLAEQSWHDPETQLPFEYGITGVASYQLCAVFSRSSDTNESNHVYQPKNHGAGRVCFQYRAGQYGQQ
jgi:type II secretory pathway pseudopilin PulG